jgi:heptosyltransferase-2
VHAPVTTPRFLIIKLVALGDVVVTTALLNRIRAESPQAHVTWLVGEGGAPLVELFPGVHEVITVDESRLLRGSILQRVRAIAGVWRRLLGRRFDRAFLVHADRRYRILTWSLMNTPVAALRHGANPVANRFRGDEYARLFDDASSRGPIVTRYPLADVRGNLPRAIAATEAARCTVVLVPGGARNILRDDALRRWPVENYRELARRLLAAGHAVTLIGDAADGRLRKAFEGLPVTDLMGASNLVETLCTLRDADLVVSHDTGPLHFARLVRTPAVALFGPTDPRQMVGPEDGIDVCWGGEQLACRPCYDGRNYAACSNNLCMQDVTVGRVMNAVAARLAGVTRSPTLLAR